MPQFFLEVKAFLAQSAVPASLVLRTEELKQAYHRASGRQWGPHMWAACLGYLHNIGEALVRAMSE